MSYTFKPAKRLEFIKPSVIRRFYSLAKEIPNVIDMTVGEPDFVPPIHVLEAGWSAAKEGKTHYGPTRGLSELREALAKKAYRDYYLRYDPDSEVLITIGGTEAIFSSLFSLVDPSDQVLIPDPGFVCYEPGVFLVGGLPIYVPLHEEQEFKPNLNDLESLITKKSRIIILNYPSNPTGAVLTYDEAAAIASIAVEHDMIVISDEVYEKITYDNAEHHCIAAFPDMRERTLVIGAFSKNYAMTGLRIGYVYGPKELITNVWLAHQYVAAPANTLAQYVAIAALEDSQGFPRAMVKEFDKRRQLACRRLNRIEGFRCLLPKGAFYVFPSIMDFGLPSKEFAQFLLKEAHVATVPGCAFGKHGEGYLRISYAMEYEKIVEALDRIEKAAKKLI